MAKRKRLAPPQLAPQVGPQTDLPADLETKALKDGWAGIRRPPAPASASGVASAPPIAEVAGQSAAQAAFEEVAGELTAAREEGRLVQAVPLSAIRTDHLVRDRIALDQAEMDSLCASLKARGQQTPVEVVALDGGSYGLISGLRRVEALKRLDMPTVLALVRQPASAGAAYVAMVEENEVRANLSFYERARIVSEAARIGIYPGVEAAVQGLFASASASKRSKILSFVALHSALGSHLRFPSDIPEKLGLALVRALDKTPDLAARLRDALRKTPPEDAASERRALERAIARSGATGGGKAEGVRRETLAPGLHFQAGKGRIVLSGARLDDKLAEDLRAWLRTRG